MNPLVLIKKKDGRKMDENVVKLNSKQEVTAIMSIVFGCIGIAMLLVSYFSSGIFYEMLGDHIDRLPIYDQLLSLGLGLPIPFGVVGLLLAILSDRESKYRTPGIVVNVVSLALVILIPLAFVGFIGLIWSVIAMTA